MYDEIAHFLPEHDRLRAEATTLLAAVEAGDALAAVAALDELAAAAQHHLRHEHLVVDEVCSRVRAPEAAALAHAFAQVAALADDALAAAAAQWTPAAAAQGFPYFAEDMRELVRLLRAITAREEAEMYPSLARLVPHMVSDDEVTALVPLSTLRAAGLRGAKAPDAA